MRIFVLCTLVFLSQSLNTLAEDLASAPGWSLNRIQQEKADNDYSYGDSRVYFSLKPPDQRPAITIDSRAAERLRSGETSAEGTYSGQAQNTAQQNRDEEYVYGNKSNGLVVAEPVASTLTLADGRREADSQPVQPRSSSSSSSESSLGGLSTGESGNFKTYAASSNPIAKRDSTASSAPPPSAVAPVAASAAPTVIDPRVIAQAQNQVPVDSAKGLLPGSIAAGNEASGFAIKKRDKDGKEIKEKDKNFIVWPDGEPGSNRNKPVCAKSFYKSYDLPTVERITIPKGCQIISVRAWGGGGGYGGMDDGGFLQGGGKGGGGAFVYTSGIVDTGKFDVLIVVGGAGGHAKGRVGGDPGFISGGKGGNSNGYVSGGGGGGGYSGVFLVERSKVAKDDKPIEVDKAIVIAAGGGGGGASGHDGGVGGIIEGGGSGATQHGGGLGVGNGQAGVSLMGGNAGDAVGALAAGGGGGGGLFGGGGGGSATTLHSAASGGGGGSSFYRFLDKFETGTASGASAGNRNHRDRGAAGDAGKPGKVILEFY